MIITGPDRGRPKPDPRETSALLRAERRALRLLALHEVALSVGGQSDPNHSLELILDQARSLLSAPAGSVYLWDERRQVLQCRLAQNVPDGMLGGSIQPGEGAAGAAFRDCKTVLISNYRGWSGASELGRAAGIVAAVSVPLRVGDRLLGSLTVHTYEPAQSFDEEDAWLLELLGDQAAIAVEQARLVEQAQRRAERLLALHRVSSVLSAPAELGATFRLILAQASEILKRRGGVIHLWDQAAQRLMLAEEYGLPTGVLKRSLAPGEGVAGQVWRQEKPVLVNDYPHWTHATATGVAAGYLAVAGVPLLAAGRMLGVLTIVAEAEGPPFTAEDVQFLELFAGQAAAALENARLFRAATRARALEELNRLKSEFISTVSHELRTPLTYIQGYSELLLRREFEPKMMKEAAGEIHASSVRMARLVDDLLDLSRLEAGRLPLRPRPIDLAEVLNSAVGAARVQAPERLIRLELEPLPVLRGDPDRLRQVLDNLLSNAQRYAPNGPITVRGRCLEARVRVEVEDQGPGISPADQVRIFEPFYRGAKSEVLPLRGGGLGLTIVHRLIEAHGGEVGLESQPGQGCRFWFSLPIEPAAASDRPDQPDSSDAAIEPDGR